MSESVAGWMAVLERIERSLEQTLGRTPEVLPAAGDGGAALEAPLARLERRFEQLGACLQRVERVAAGAEADLDADEQAVRAWLEAVTVAGRALAARAADGA